MSHTIRNFIGKLRHKGPKSQLEICQMCGRLVINELPFPFALCQGTEKDPHRPFACRKA